MYPALEVGRSGVAESDPLPHLSDRAASMPPDFATLDSEAADWDFPHIWRNNAQLTDPTTPQKAHTAPADHLGEPFSHRAREVAQVLAPFAKSSESRSHLDNAIDQNLFSVANMRYFEHLYIKNSHRHCPILHLPTFKIESAPMPLFLAIFLGGSLHSHPRDTFSLAADYFDIVDAYFFSLPVFQPEHNIDNTNESQKEGYYDNVKAAAILLHLQIGRNDPDIRKRVRYRRFPLLVHAARSLSLFESKHDCSSTLPESWIWNPQSESLIRTATFILLLDCQFVVCLRSPPMLLLSESTGHLPCAEVMFRHDSLSSVNTPHPPSLLETIDLLMSDAWDESSYNSLDNTGIFGFFSIISGLHLVIFSSFQSRMIQRQLTNLERALGRWKRLWERLISQIGQEEIDNSGFMANGNEVWLVAKMLLRTDVQDFCRGLDSQSLHPFRTLLRRVKEVADQ